MNYLKPTDSAALLCRTVSVGQYRVTFTVPRPQPGQAGCMTVEFEPSVSTGLSESELQEYRIARNSFLEEAASILGGNVICVEV